MIYGNTPIIEVLRKYPQSRSVFAKLGMACIGCMGSAQETVENGARMHGLDPNLLICELNKLLQ